MVAAAYLYPFVRSFNEAPDAGVFLYGAEMVSRGAVPSRDFVEMQGPGSFGWLALFFRLFGATLETARSVLLMTGVGLGLLAFRLSRRLGALGLFAAVFVVVMSIPLLPINSPHYDSNLFALAALVVFLPAWDKILQEDEPPFWRLVSSAALCGVATWMIQQKGLYVALALGVSLASASRRRAVLVLGGTYAAMAALPFVYFAAVHALPDVWFANYLWPVTTYSAVNAAPYGFPVWENVAFLGRQQAAGAMAWIVETASVTPFLMIAGLPLLVPASAALSGRHWFRKATLPYWLAAYALFIAELHRMDMGHLRNGAVLLGVMLLSICEASGNVFVKGAGLTVTACLALAGTSHFAMSWAGETMQTRRGEMVVEDEAALLRFLELHTHPGEEVFVYPYQPVFYFLEDLRNPTRYSYLLYGFNSKAQFQEATQSLERKQVRYVIVDSVLSGGGMAAVFPAYREPPRADLIMEPYLEAHYRGVANAGRFRVLERVR